jgi:cytochrome c biogenesis protein CcmG, thiol:disulfide interchange protein DsbE
VRQSGRRRGAAPATLTGVPLLLFLLLCASCGGEPERFRPMSVGDLTPAFAAAELAGDTLRLGDLKGSAVLLNVWATWCAPCREEMPGLEEVHRIYGSRGLRVVGVSIDSRGAEDAVRGFLTDHGISFTILHDPGEAVQRQFRTSGVPETFLIDPDGRIAHRWIGRFDPLAPDALQRIEAALP